MRISFLLLIGLLIINWSYSQTIVPGGDVSGSWTIEGSPYFVEGGLTIRPADTLIIEPGVEVILRGHYGIYIDGVMMAQGLEGDSITFMTEDTTGLSNPEIPDGGWHGIRFIMDQNVNRKSYFSYCKILYAKGYGEGFFELAGAAFHINAYTRAEISHCLISDCWNISADYGASGGAIFIYSNSFVSISDCSIINNRGRIGAGIYIQDFADPVIQNCLIKGNKARGSGGGMYVWFACEPFLQNNTICDNEAFQGGGLYLHGSSPVMYNCIVYGNLVSDKGTSMVLRDIHDEYYDHYSDPDIYNSNIEGGPDGFALSNGATYSGSYINNLDTIPGFTGEGPHPFSLVDDSPCVDAGRNTTGSIQLPETDILGNDRIIGLNVDMGAYENLNSTTGIAQPQPAGKLLIYPNPAGDWITIDEKLARETERMIICDISGQVVLTRILPRPEINIGDLSPGIYLLMFHTFDGNVQYAKVVVE